MTETASVSLDSPPYQVYKLISFSIFCVLPYASAVANNHLRRYKQVYTYDQKQVERPVGS
jgi:hypothetical protein